MILKSNEKDLNGESCKKEWHVFIFRAWCSICLECRAWLAKYTNTNPKLMLILLQTIEPIQAEKLSSPEPYSPPPTGTKHVPLNCSLFFHSVRVLSISVFTGTKNIVWPSL